MKTKEMLDLIVVLKRLRDQGPEFLEGGICFNVNMLMDSMFGYDYFEQEKLQPYFKTWLGYSGDPLFPIANYRSHFNNYTLWVGDQLLKRQHLINHLIVEITEACNEPT